MSVIRNFLPIKRKHMGGLLILFFISIICVAFSMTGNDDFDFGFGLDIILWYVCLVLSIGGVKNNHQVQGK